MARQMADHTSKLMCREGVAEGTMACLAAMSRDSSGIWGASRHALTVGFLAMMVFAIGQRVLPAFSGMRLLFSTKLMFCSLLVLAVGCLLLVSSEVLAYQDIVRSAWSLVPTSAICEMAAVTVFAFNLLITFARDAPATAAQPLTNQGNYATRASRFRC